MSLKKRTVNEIDLSIAAQNAVKTAETKTLKEFCEELRKGALELHGLPVQEANQITYTLKTGYEDSTCSVTVYLKEIQEKEGWEWTEIFGIEIAFDFPVIRTRGKYAFEVLEGDFGAFAWRERSGEDYAR